MPNQKYPPKEKIEEYTLAAGESRRPVISQFYGILLQVCYDDAQRQLHAAYGEHTAAFDFGGKLLAGSFPEKQRMYVEVWADMRRIDLAVLAKLLQTEDAYFTIRGLN